MLLLLGLSPNTEYVVYVSATNGVSELAMESPALVAATESKSSTVGTASVVHSAC